MGGGLCLLIAFDCPRLLPSSASDHMRNVVRWKVSMEFGAAERSLIGQLALHLGFPRDESSLRSYLSGENGTLIDLLPELGTLRDVSFYVCCSTSTHAASE